MSLCHHQLISNLNSPYQVLEHVRSFPGLRRGGGLPLFCQPQRYRCDLFDPLTSSPVPCSARKRSMFKCMGLHGSALPALAWGEPRVAVLPKLRALLPPPGASANGVHVTLRPHRTESFAFFWFLNLSVVSQSLATTRPSLYFLELLIFE